MPIKLKTVVITNGLAALSETAKYGLIILGNPQKNGGPFCDSTFHFMETKLKELKL